MSPDASLLVPPAHQLGERLSDNLIGLIVCLERSILSVLTTQVVIVNSVLHCDAVGAVYIEGVR
jgi:hypothetical protein